MSDKMNLPKCRSDSISLKFFIGCLLPWRQTPSPQYTVQTFYDLASECQNMEILSFPEHENTFFSPHLCRLYFLCPKLCSFLEAFQNGTAANHTQLPETVMLDSIHKYYPRHHAKFFTYILINNTDNNQQCHVTQLWCCHFWYIVHVNNTPWSCSVHSALTIALCSSY